jgi:hypothetical protein
MGKRTRVNATFTLTLPVLSSHRPQFNTLNPELNPICHLLALLGAHHILHVSRVTVNLILQCLYSTVQPQISWLYKKKILKGLFCATSNFTPLSCRSRTAPANTKYSGTHCHLAYVFMIIRTTCYMETERRQELNRTENQHLFWRWRVR